MGILLGIIATVVGLIGAVIFRSISLNLDSRNMPDDIAKNILTLLLILFSYLYISTSQKKSIQQFASFTLKSGCTKADFL